MERVELTHFKDLDGNLVYKGNRVAIAVYSKWYRGLRVGKVISITGYPGDGGYKKIRVKVKVDESSQTMFGSDKSYLKTYDLDNRIVKVGF